MSEPLPAIPRLIARVDTDYRQWIGVSIALSVLIAAVINAFQGDRTIASILLGASVLFTVVLLRFTAKRRGDRTTFAAAQAAAGPDDVIVLWRPGCLHCDRLKLRLGDDRRHVIWVNTLHDPQAAAFVTAIHDGDEVVPTAVTGVGTPIPATPTAIRHQLQGARP